MNFRILLLLSLFTFSVFAQKKKALMVIVDGIPADLLESTATPNIDQISGVGGYSRAFVGGERGTYSQTPTISAVSYNSMLTGTWVNKHNVWNNSITAPNYHYPTLFYLTREIRPEMKLGIYSTWTDNRTKLLGENLPETNYLKLDFKIDGFELDKQRFPHDGQSEYINKIDEEVVKNAVRILKEEAPELSWVYLQYTDDIGHKEGDSEKMRLAIQKMDRQMGDLFQAIRFREQYKGEDWLMIIVTDHGRDFVRGLNHGGQSFRERMSWVATNSKQLNAYFAVYTPGIVDVLPTVARHLDLDIPQKYAYELDGIPLIGRVSLAEPRAAKVKDKLRLEWTPLEKEGKVKVLVSSENYFEKTGQSDQYEFLGEFELSKGKAEILLSQKYQDAKFLKIVLEGEKNVVNRWIITE
jgi:hypothetical protein